MPNVCELLKTIGHLGMSFSIPIYQRQYLNFSGLLTLKSVTPTLTLAF